MSYDGQPVEIVKLAYSVCESIAIGKLHAFKCAIPDCPEAARVFLTMQSIEHHLNVYHGVWKEKINVTRKNQR